MSQGDPRGASLGNDAAELSQILGLGGHFPSGSRRSQQLPHQTAARDRRRVLQIVAKIQLLAQLPDHRVPRDLAAVDHQVDRLPALEESLHLVAGLEPPGGVGSEVGIAGVEQ